METINIKQLKDLISCAGVMINKNNHDEKMTVEFLQWSLDLIFKIEVKVIKVTAVDFDVKFFTEGEWHYIESVVL